MDQATRSARQRLTERRDALKEQMETLSASAVEVVARTESRDRSQGTPDVELRGHLADRESAEIRELDAALARIDAGTYGECESCGDPIGQPRLSAVPEARLCLMCSGLRKTRGTGARAAHSARPRSK